MSIRRVLAIEASLRCELDGHVLGVSANDGVIVIKASDFDAARALFGCARHQPGIRSTLARLTAALNASSQRVEFRVEDAVIASMGAGTRSGFLRVLGLPNTRVWPLRLLRASAPS